MAATKPASRWARPFVWILLVPVGLLAAVVLFLPRERLVHEIVERALPAASRAIGRPVTVAGASVQFLPPGASLSGLKIAGAEGEPAFLDVGHASVRIALWKAITSLGRDIEVKSVVLDKPEVTLVRRADGTWSHDEILANLAKSPKSEEKTAVALDALELADGRVAVVDRQGGGERSLAMEHLGVKLRNLAPGADLHAELEGALAGEKKNLEAKLDVEPLPMGPVTAGNAPTVTGHVKLDPLALAQIQRFAGPSVTGLVHGGTAKIDLDVKTAKPGTYALDGKVALDGLVLRGQPASGGADLHGTVDAAKPGAARILLENLALKGPGVDVGGRLEAQLPSKVRFSLQGRELDLETLLGVMPEKAQAPEKTAKKPSPGLAKLDVVGDVKFDEVKSGKLRATGFEGAVQLAKGVLTVTRGRAAVFGGAVALDGTTVDLAAPEPAWRLKADVQHLALQEAQQALSGAALMGGAMDLSLDVAGAGKDWAKLRSNLDGTGKMALKDGSVGTLDLSTAVAQPLAAALKQAGQPGAASRVSGEGGTKLKDLAGAFRIDKGWMVFDKPLAVDTPAGALALKGRVGLDQRLALDGELATAPQLVSQVAGGAFGNTPVPLPLRLAGSLSKPQLALADGNTVAQKLVEAQGRRATKGLQDRAVDELRRRFGR